MVLIPLQETLQEIHVDRKADRAGPLPHFSEKTVVLPAGKYACWHTLNVSLENDAVIIIHIIDDRKIDHEMFGCIRRFQKRGQVLEFSDGMLITTALPQHAEYLCRCACRIQDPQELPAGRQVYTIRTLRLHTLRRPLIFTKRACLFQQCRQLMQVLFADQADRFPAGFRGQAELIKQTGNDAEMRDIQKVVPGDGLQAFCCQIKHLADAVRVDITNAFDTCLQDLLIRMRAFGNPVNIFIIKDPADGPRLLARSPYDGQGDVRFERHQLAVGIGKGDDVVRDQEVLVARIQVIFLELAHLVLPVSETRIQGSQQKDDLFFVFQYDIVLVHGGFRSL